MRMKNWILYNDMKSLAKNKKKNNFIFFFFFLFLFLNRVCVDFIRPYCDALEYAALSKPVKIFARFLLHLPGFQTWWHVGVGVTGGVGSRIDGRVMMTCRQVAVCC